MRRCVGDGEEISKEGVGGGCGGGSDGEGVWMGGGVLMGGGS